MPSFLSTSSSSSASSSSSSFLSKMLAGFFILGFNNRNNRSSALSLEDCISALTMNIIIEFLVSHEHAKKSGVVLSNESASKIAATTKIVAEFRKAAEKEVAKNKVTKNIDVSGDAMKKQQFSIEWIEKHKLYNYRIQQNINFLKKIFDNKKLSNFLSIQDGILFIGNYKFTEVNFVSTHENELKLFVASPSGLVEIDF